MHGTLFSPRTVRLAVRKLHPALVALERLHGRLLRLRPSAGAEEQRVAPGYYRNLRSLLALVENVRRIGIHVRDLRGELDFPALRRGEPVLLAWDAREPGRLRWRRFGEDPVQGRPVAEDDGWHESAKGKNCGA